MNRFRKISILVSASILIYCCWLGPQDNLATLGVEAGMTRALASFAVARSLNAAISVAQESSVYASVLGVGGTLAVGQFLDPINDLVESFSSLMLMACVAFGVQAILLKIGGEWVLMASVTVVILVWVAISIGGRKPSAWLTRLALILAMVRFAIPVTIIGSDFVFERLLSPEYVSSQQAISTATEKLEEITSGKQENVSKEVISEEPGFLEKYTGIRIESINLPVIHPIASAKLKYESVKAELENAVRRAIDLIVIFLMQTLVVPIFILWAMYGVAKRSIDAE